MNNLIFHPVDNSVNKINQNTVVADHVKIAGNCSLKRKASKSIKNN